MLVPGGPGGLMMQGGGGGPPLPQPMPSSVFVTEHQGGHGGQGGQMVQQQQQQQQQAQSPGAGLGPNGEMMSADGMTYISGRKVGRCRLTLSNPR
jgi:hypothetical protein